jgi:fatty-acid peroxygenase
MPAVGHGAGDGIDLIGRQLEPSVAAVELINLLRPTVAIARFVTFAALALHEHPEWHDRLVTAGDAELEMFVQEVRRYYPFFPMVGGLVREPFTWRGHHFDEKDWVLLDLYGTDHDPRSWPEPDRFWPGRFRDRVITAFDLVPQGAGRHATTHRCPGEWITIEIMKTVTRLLVADTDYDVPAQDLTISFSKMPTGPASGFVMTNVRKAA